MREETKFEYILQQGERIPRVILDKISDSISCLSAEGKYLYVNQAFIAETGKTNDQIIGKTIWDVFDKEEAEQRIIPMNEIFKSGQERTIEFTVNLADSEKVFLTKLSPVMDEHGGVIYVICSSQDITEKSEIEMQLRLDYEEAAASCMKVLMEDDRIDQQLHRILNILLNAAQVDRAYIFQNSDNPELGLCMSQTHEATAEGIKTQIDFPLLQQLPYYESSPKLLEALESRSPYMGIVSEMDELEQDILEQQGILSILILPIFCGQKLWGFIGFDNCTIARHWRREDISLLQIIADGIGATIFRQQTEQALRESEQKYRLIADNTGDNISVLDMHLNLIYTSPSVQSIRGYTVEEVMHQSLEQILTPDSAQKAIAILREQISLARTQKTAPFKTIKTELEEYHKDGSTVLIEASISFIRDSNLEPTGIVVISRDISERKQAEEELRAAYEQMEATMQELIAAQEELSYQYEQLQKQELALRESEDKFRSLFENMQEGVALSQIVYDENNNVIDYIVIDTNPAFEKQTGISPEKILNMKGSPLFNLEKVPFLDEFATVVKTRIPLSFETYFAPVQKYFHISVFSPKPNQIATIFEDITERKKVEAQIEYLSFHDSLTGLYNRRYFEEELKRLDKPRNLPLTMIMADVNGLKLANDAFGHLLGDKLLQRAAHLIQREFRGDDIVARIGGDEFVILLPKTNSRDAEYLVNRIRSAISGEKVDSIELSVSFGWATKTDSAEKMEEIYKQAEDSMYRRKLYESPSMRGNTIKTIINTVHEKLPEEKEHSERVSGICQKIGEKLGYSIDDMAELKMVGLMHDIGKITLNETLLHKPGPLDELEWAEVKRHPETGYRILGSVNEMAQLAEYVLAHHENWDGSGYPKGLKGEEIPLLSRIIRIADSYEAMTSSRPYRKALSKSKAIEEIKLNAGIQFDPVLATQFVEQVCPYLD